MAEIQTQTTQDKKKRINKRTTRVDLTPMVDLGFLLLTFFVFTTRLSEAKAMDLVMPYDKTITVDKVCESCVITVLLDEHNIIKYYEGAAGNKASVKETGYSPLQIRKILMDKKAAVQQARGNADAFILIIKASSKSTFKNFVDMTDEVSICAIKRYYIDEMNEFDRSLLRE